ncbi:hypothetical protein CHS0354_039146 [Potamilus streckersoni]|uniref:Uncharacterized protein n=1 Tax=Potamilus streckersoni TaxID=2493646 RepID=A0AAE0VQP5_9BIVA|nr:hypothetical protein CHS0354_039146 [Potamilus streckersoni]
MEDERGERRRVGGFEIRTDGRESEDQEFRYIRRESLLRDARSPHFGPYEVTSQQIGGPPPAVRWVFASRINRWKFRPAHMPGILALVPTTCHPFN